MRRSLRIIYFNQSYYTDYDLIWGLLELGLEPRIGEMHVPRAEYGEADAEAIEAELGDAELALTRNFSPAVAEACRSVCLIS